MKQIEFYVDRVLPRDGGVDVVGRCLNGPIRIGDQFLWQRTKSGRVPVSFTVEEIVFWGKKLDMLEPSHVGKLSLVGSGSETIEGGSDVLAEDPTTAN